MLVDRAAASTTAVFLYWDESFSFYLQGKEVSTKSKGGKRTWSTSPHFPLLQETAYEIYSMSNCPCLFFIKKKILWIDECKVFFSIFWPDTIMTGAPSSGSTENATGQGSKEELRGDTPRVGLISRQWRQDRWEIFRNSKKEKLRTKSVCVWGGCSVLSNLLVPHGVTRLLCPWGCPGKNTGVGCHFLLQGIFLTQELNLHLSCLLHWQADSLPLVPLGKPTDCLGCHKKVQQIGWYKQQTFSPHSSEE